MKKSARGNYKYRVETKKGRARYFDYLSKAKSYAMDYLTQCGINCDETILISCWDNVRERPIGKWNGSMWICIDSDYWE